MRTLDVKNGEIENLRFILQVQYGIVRNMMITFNGWQALVSFWKASSDVHDVCYAPYFLSMCYWKSMLTKGRPRAPYRWSNCSHTKSLKSAGETSLRPKMEQFQYKTRNHWKRAVLDAKKLHCRKFGEAMGLHESHSRSGHAPSKQSSCNASSEATGGDNSRPPM